MLTLKDLKYKIINKERRYFISGVMYPKAAALDILHICNYNQSKKATAVVGADLFARLVRDVQELKERRA